MLYASDPWAVMSGSLASQVAQASERRAAQSFVRQGREYFLAAERAATIETKPLLYYYAFLNLAKALGIARGRPNLVGRVVHGISNDATAGLTVPTAEIKLHRSRGTNISALDELHVALVGSQLPSGAVPIRELLPQSVVAHRLWCDASGRVERFLSVNRVNLHHDESGKRIWATIGVRADTARAHRRGVQEIVNHGGLSPTFRAVRLTAENVAFMLFEQVTPVPYTHRPSDEVMSVIESVRHVLWQTVTSAPPYRRYYLYLSPVGEARVPQWLSVYAVLFWLGSLTRYHPGELLDIFDGSYGPFLRELLETQPSQLLYLLASEFKQQEVARAAVV
jgi:hypothetical protein